MTMPMPMQIARLSVVSICLLLALAVSPAAAAPLHVPSPDWRDQIIYFVLLDRFDDGDPSNNDQGAGEFDPSDPRKYSGGDLRGVLNRLDYIRGLGATAVWITPPVANQWWDGELGYGGYHGYWAENFKAVDAHYGSLDDYRALSRGLHGAGMYLLQDVVVNHTGNFFSYRDGWDAADPSAFYRPNARSTPVDRPSQWPFSINDPRRPADREAAIYHFTPTIADFTERAQELDHQLADLDDLNTENPQVRRALRESYGYWIREVGVDGFRVDTAFHVPEAFFTDFMHAEDAEHPGMIEVARQTGRQQFIAFGEGFGVDAAYDDTRARKLERYVRGPAGEPRLSSMINFPLYGSLLDVFARGRPSAELGHRIRSMLEVHADPHRMPSFVDNHDVDRFLAGGSAAGLRQALLAIMTLPGIPTIYYGTEQGFRLPRQAMFAGGFAAQGRDHFDRDAPLYRYIAEIAALRRAHPPLSRGRPVVLRENSAAAGALVYRVDEDGVGAGEQSLWVMFNTADHDSLLDRLDTGLPAGSPLRPVFSIDGRAEPVVVDADSQVTLRLPARSGVVWQAVAAIDEAPLRAANAIDSTPARAANAIDPTPARAATMPSIDPLGAETVGGSFEVSGRAAPRAALSLVVDGNLGSAQPVVADGDGRWQARVDTDDLLGGASTHTLLAWSARSNLASPPRTFRVDRRWQLLLDHDDPHDDDHGPQGRYRYPSAPGWQARPLDIRRVRVLGSGGALQIEVQMRHLLAAWNPPNGFDHLAITLFIELPDRDDGVRVMPLQHAELPDGMRWHYRLRAGGWSSALYAADGASAAHEGRALAAAVGIAVDRDKQTLRFTLPATALGAPSSWSGARLYLTSWDYDGGYRPLQAAPGAHAFGGGNATDPRIMDAVGPMQIP